MEPLTYRPDSEGTKFHHIGLRDISRKSWFVQKLGEMHWLQAGHQVQRATATASQLGALPDFPAPSWWEK